MGKIKVIEIDQEFTKTRKVKINLNNVQSLIPSIDIVYTEKKFEELDKQKEDCERRLLNNLACSKAVQEIIREVFDSSLLIYKIMDVKVELDPVKGGYVGWSGEENKWTTFIDAFNLVCKKYELSAVFYIWSNREIPKDTDNILIKTSYLGQDTRFKAIFNRGELQKDGTYIQPFGRIVTDLRDVILDDYKNNIEDYTTKLYKEQNI